MEGATATRQRWNVRMTTMDGATATETATGMATMMATATVMDSTMATAMDGTTATAMEDAKATRQQRRRWMAPWRRNGDDCGGRRDGDGDGQGY